MIVKIEDLISSGERLNVRVVNFISLSRFFVNHPINSHYEAVTNYKKVLKEVVQDKHNNTKLYQLRDGTIKIVADRNFSQGYRARIDTIFCPVENDRLAPGARVILLDTGVTWSVDLSRIFEFPPIIRHWALSEPLVLECCMYNKSEQDCRVPELEEHIQSAVTRKNAIRIVFKDRVDGRCFVDVIMPKPGRFRQNGAKQNGKVENKPNQRNKKFQDGRKSHSTDWVDPKISCYSYIHNIHQSILKKHEKGFLPSLRESLLGVEILWWEGPDLIYVRPADPIFKEFSRRYQEQIDRSMLREDDHYDESNNRVYDVSEFCLMRNEASDKNGKWIRGRVELVAETDDRKSNMDTKLSKDQLNELEETLGAMSLRHQCLDSSIAPLDLVYKVRSIDYGFVCLRTRSSMRPLCETFKKVGSLSMRCSLFGIHPTGMYTDDSAGRVWSDSALSVMDQWINDRRFKRLCILVREDEERKNYLVHDSVNPLYTDNVRVNIFCLGKWKIALEKFESLSSELIDRGLAIDYCDATRTSSRIFIDEELLNTTELTKLVPIDEHLSTDYRKKLQNLGTVR